MEEVRGSLDSTDNGTVKNSIRNCLTVFQNDPKLEGAIRYNILTERIDIVKPLWWSKPTTTLNDTDLNYLMLYLEDQYTLTSEKKIQKAISIVADCNKYHPIRDYLNGLEWDGTERIRCALPHFLGAEESEFTYECLRLFMLGAISRVFKPGSKFETMLCLVGGQGAGKSTFFRLLAIKDEWFSEHIIRTKILPYFKKRKLSEITARDVIDWQNEIRQHTKSSGESYSPDYLKNVHTQLGCIFNHAIKYYGLQINPAAKAGNMGSEQPKEMLFWAKEEYLKFIDAMMDKPMLYYAFEILYWCGIREGELLALTPADFDFEKKTLRINKYYQRLQGKDVITTPKTKKSNRVIHMPDFLCDEMQDYFKQLYGLEPDSRIFPLSKYALKRGMEFGCKASGVKVIRIHDLRHSHVSLLINMGYSAVAIGNRVGHESVEITYRYAHLFSTVQKEMADKLNVERSN